MLRDEDQRLLSIVALDGGVALLAKQTIAVPLAQFCFGRRVGHVRRRVSKLKVERRIFEHRGAVRVALLGEAVAASVRALAHVYYVVVCELAYTPAETDCLDIGWRKVCGRKHVFHLDA